MKRPEILLIGTSSSLRGLLKDAYQISEYDNQTEVIDGLKFRKEHRFQMPDMIICPSKGIENHPFNELSGWISQLDEAIPIFVIGNKESKTEVDLALDFGATDFIDEKTSPSDLLLKIQVVLRVRKQRIIAEELSQYQVPLDKRIFDILVSSVLILMLSPVFLAIMLAVRLESKGPVFYWQPRVGSGYRIFRFFKFRSMRVNADKQVDALKKNNHYQVADQQIPVFESSEYSLVGDHGPVDEAHFLAEKARESANSFFKLKNDPRITRVGQFIRNTSLDELPQLVNVLIGDMSIVGNRPLPLYEAEKLTDDRWAERFLAPAGITGLWQVTERGKANTSEDSRKLLDIEYARKYNLFFDLKILIKTPLAALQHENV